MRPARAALTCLALAIALAGPASAKEIESTVCGATSCRTVTNGIAGIGTRSGPVPVPRSGRFFTVEMHGQRGWKVVFEARRGIVRALDVRTRSLLGRAWLRLTVDVRPHFVRAVRGLAPMRSAMR
jgi:hypothetical protein